MVRNLPQVMAHAISADDRTISDMPVVRPKNDLLVRVPLFSEPLNVLRHRLVSYSVGVLCRLVHFCRLLYDPCTLACVCAVAGLAQRDDSRLSYDLIERSEILKPVSGLYGRDGNGKLFELRYKGMLSLWIERIGGRDVVLREVVGGHHRPAFLLQHLDGNILDLRFAVSEKHESYGEILGIGVYDSGNLVRTPVSRGDRMVCPIVEEADSRVVGAVHTQPQSRLVVGS